MANENLVIPRLDLGDIVVVNSTVYIITSILPGAFDLAPEAPFVYGMVTVESGDHLYYHGKETFVWEGHLKSITDRDLTVWRILYGDQHGKF